MKVIRIPRALHELFGERQSPLVVASIVLFGAAGGMRV